MENCLDPQLWFACAGGMAQVPPPNSRVYYFPQGHAEHANETANLAGFGKIPPLIPCIVSSVKYLADSESDEVFAKIRLVPVAGDDEFGDEFVGFDKNSVGEMEKSNSNSNSFAKTLTQSDANNGGGFSVPRYCAETLFPRLDYTSEPPVQTILAKDVHGEVWKFRHIYRGTPRRHLLTTGWSSFVGRKKLVAGDSIVFLRAENGDLCVGIRRAKGGGGGFVAVGDGGSGWNCGYRGFSGGGGTGRRSEFNDVITLAARGREFEVVYYPRASTPEFVVAATSVRAAMGVRWSSGMRFKMAFETEDSSRISWFMGTVSSAFADDPILYPNSPWRFLQVIWDEPELLHNLKRVNPWQVELVSNVPAAVHFSPPRKRARLPQFPEITINRAGPGPRPSCYLQEDVLSVGIQGTRQTRQFESGYMGLKPFDFKLLDYSGPFPRFLMGHSLENRSSKAGSSTVELAKNEVSRGEPMFLLFGQPILTADQIKRSYSGSNNSLSEENAANVSNGSGSGVIQSFYPEASSDGEFPALALA
ncbi:auxin response factor 18-like [Andrographis paniculata]|uniref:auxin response factor 18-like n=1 Tax=Andrographis paniculata TaxID=175694 RepID=UPI0021E9277B|nr:auxin response factor 18-like [Andrographis paniculata]XP_051119815.1 auxin response factor 18-like [Andrographis paniculata]